MIISVTERSVFKRCRRLWSYTSFNQQSLGTIVPRTALSLGTTIHNALAQWMLTPDVGLPELFAIAAAADHQQIKDNYRKRIGAEISDSELQPYHEGFELGLAMCKNYQQMWGSPLPEGFRLVQPETQAEVAIPGTIHVLSGRLDAIIQNISNGDLLVVDHKTYGVRPKLNDLQNNDQFLAYQWLVAQLNIGHVAGVAYDGLYKRATPPRGSEFKDLFTRLLIYRPDYEVDGFTAQLRQEVLDMEDAVNNNRLYPNRVWQGCWDDYSFNEICAAESRGEDSEHIKRANFMRVDKDKLFVVEE